jgi:hypothetical protein
MKTKLVVEMFGTRAAVARAIGISKAAVCAWGETVPLSSAARLEKATSGLLKLDLESYKTKRQQ